MANPAGKNIFAFLGSDGAQVKEAATALAGKLVPAGSEDFGLEIIEGQADHSEHAAEICARTIEAIQTLPFMGGEKVVWLKAASFLGDNRTGRADAAKNGADLLAQTLSEGVPADVTFILSTTEIDKRRSFYKTLSKIAKIETFDRPNTTRDGWQEEVSRLVQNRAKTLNLQFTSPALERFIATVGEDTAQIGSELEKLDLFLGSDQREVTPDTVKTIVSETRAGIVFEISRSISDRNLAQSLQQVDYLLNHGENAISIIRAAIIPEVRKLLGAAMFRTQIRQLPRNYREFQSLLDGLPAAVTNQLARNKDGKLSAYPLFLALQDRPRYSAGELQKGLSYCLKTDVRLVTTSTDHKVLLTQLLARIIGNPKTA